ncbi:MAG TPA: protein kinase [Candidatus Acidoferrum sp.]|jgi:serine/threonine protein kinase/Tol biopolymer transport system component
MQITDGQTIAHYRIVRRLGGGGMGVVYQAEDTKLGRLIALKFLPAETDRDASALARFLREARAASALNHPGICTIHAIEEYEGRTFIAMELLEGEGLDKIVAMGSMPVGRTMEIGIQLADALDAAHKKGIVHRDIKPANIFITERGTVKVLDFGLAKLLKDVDEAGGDTIGDMTNLLTSPGMAVGTISYMSPEQARGQELDGRSDLFSLGTVLYQMLTGKQAFPGSTSAVVFDNILHNQPVAPVTLNPAVPAEFERILNKALEKDRDFRFQVAAELRSDLKRLQRESDSGRTAAASGAGSGSAQRSPASGTGAAPAPSGGGVAAATLTPSAPMPAARSGSSALVEAAKGNKLGVGFGILVAFILVAAAGFGVYSLLTKSSHIPFEHFSIENLTNNGHVALATISPDGKYLLNVHDETNGLQSLWLRHIQTGSNTQLVEPAATRYASLTFSPDANYIYFVRRDEDAHTIATLYSAPMLGGMPRLLIKDVDSPITFSPDGKKFAYMREHHDTPNFDLIIVNNDGTPDRTLLNNTMIATDSAVPVWLPDGKSIVIPIVQTTADSLGALLSVDVATGDRKTFAASPNRVYYEPTWFYGPGGGFVVSSATPELGMLQRQLGFLSSPKGEYRPLTTDTNNYVRPSVSSDGKAIAATQNNFLYSLSVAPAAQPDEMKPVTLQSHQPIWQWNWSQDEQLIVPQGGDLRLVQPTGGETVMLSDKSRMPDQVAACGKYVVFRALRKSQGASLTLWRMDTSGLNQVQLTFGRNEQNPQCSPDGKWLYYVEILENQALKRVSVAGGGNPEIVSEEPSAGFVLSADGKRTAQLDVRELDHRLVLNVYDIAEKKMAYHDIDSRASDPISFSPDGKSIVFRVRDKGIDNLWSQPLMGSGAAVQLTHFTAERISRFAYSLDGKKIAVERGHLEADAVLLRDAGK